MANIGESISNATSGVETSELLANDLIGIYPAKEYMELDGTTDDYTALYNLINTTINGDDAEIWFKDGTALIGTSITIPSNVKLVFLNGGIIKPDTGVVITGSNARIESSVYQIFDLSSSGATGLAGTWRFPEAYPEWFGATGDNSTDDSTTINYGVAFLDANAGGIYKFSSKTYLVGTPINIRSYITYRGDGHGTIIKQIGSATADNVFGEATTASGETGVVIEHLTVDGNKANSTHPADDANGNGIRFNQVIYSTIRNCLIQNTKNNGISVYNASNDNVIRDNIIVDNGATSGLPAVYSRMGIFVEFGANRNKICNNRISNSADIGVWCAAQGATVDDNLIEGNWIANNGAEGIWIGDNDGTTNLTRNKIVNNFVGSNTTVGIRINHAGSGSLIETIIHGNTLNANSGGGIYIQDGATRTIINGNISMSNTGDGIGTGANATDTIITNNICLSNSGTQIAMAGTRDVNLGNIVDTSGEVQSDARIQSRTDLKVLKDSGNAADLVLAQTGVINWTVRNTATNGYFDLWNGSDTRLRVTNTASSDEVALLVWVNDGGSSALRQVSMGADDSGGAGYKLLRVPN